MAKKPLVLTDLEEAVAALRRADQATYGLDDRQQRAAVRRCVSEALRWAEGARDEALACKPDERGIRCDLPAI